MQIRDVSLAVRLFYEKVALSNKDIKALFSTNSDSTVAKLKKPVLERMAAMKTPRYGAHMINTDVAFSVWGLDIEDLERRYKKLQEFGFTEGTK